MLHISFHQGTDLSCCTQEGRELFGKFVEHCESTEVEKNLIKDAISVFVFLVGRVVDDFKRCSSLSLLTQAVILQTFYL